MSALTSIDFDFLRQLEDPISGILEAYEGAGLQATAYSKAEALCKSMVQEKLKKGGKIYLAYTSNLISSGLREIFARLIHLQFFDAIVTTAGGVEEDFIKCFGSTLIGDFSLKGSALRLAGLNRVGNLLIPNNNYCKFEDKFVPLLKAVHQSQKETNYAELTTPSELLQKMGEALISMEQQQEEKKTEDEQSVFHNSLLYQCAQKNIPIFCPAITDGSIGDMLFFYNFNNPGMIMDPVQDCENFHSLLQQHSASPGVCSSVIVLGGGLPKHHLCRAVMSNTPASSPTKVLMISTGLEVDGCVSSGNIVSDNACGLLRSDTEVVRLHADATLVFPLLASRCFCTQD